MTSLAHNILTSLPIGSPERDLMVAILNHDLNGVGNALAQQPSWDRVHYADRHPIERALGARCTYQVLTALVAAAPKPLGELHVYNPQGQPCNMAGFVMLERFDKLDELPLLLNAGLSASDTTLPHPHHLGTPLRAWLNATPKINDMAYRSWRDLGQSLVDHGASVHDRFIDTQGEVTGLTLLHELVGFYLVQFDNPKYLEQAADWLVGQGLSVNAVAHNAGTKTGRYPQGQFTPLELLAAMGGQATPLYATWSALALAETLTDEPAVARRPRL